MTRVGIVTQARTGSTRLPGKVLLPLGDATVLEHHLDRLADAGLPVIVATTERPEDDVLLGVAERAGAHTFRGSEHDVLDRYVRCATAYHLDVVVRVTSDCPLVDGGLVAAAVRRWTEVGDPWTYLSNGLRRTFPRGFDLEVMSTHALVEASVAATDPADREHVTPWLYRGGDPRVRLHSFEQARDDSDLRVTLDTPDDLLLLRTLVEEHDAARLDVSEVVALLRRRPDLAALNAHVAQKALAGDVEDAS